MFFRVFCFLVAVRLFYFILDGFISVNLYKDGCVGEMYNQWKLLRELNIIKQTNLVENF